MKRIIAKARGGETLNIDFRPPSSGGRVGPIYTKMIAGVREALFPNPSRGHHEFGNAETCFPVGDVMGKAMIKILKQNHNNR